MIILACGQCFITIAQVIAVVSACFAPLFYFLNNSANKLKNKFDNDDS
jgi:hypothetical protein